MSPSSRFADRRARAANRFTRMLLIAAVAAACSTPSPGQPSGNPSTSEAAIGSSTPGAGPNSQTGPLVLQFDTPFPWSTLPVSGRLLFITYNSRASTSALPVPFIALLDLATGGVTAVWHPPENTWLSGMDLSPDGTKLALAYAAPPLPGLLQSGSPGLYLLPGDCLKRSCAEVAPQVIVEASQTDTYFGPVWSPDGMDLYFTHFSSPANSQTQIFNVERVPADGGTPERLIANATWPRRSPDGKMLAYVAFDILQSTNDLYFAAPDGTSDVRPAMPPGSFLSVDAPVFSPDGQYIYFSATGDFSRSLSEEVWPDHRTWLERLTGVQSAYANGMPSEWWRLPIAGGDPTRLSNIQAAGLSGAFSPDGQFFAFISYSGMAMMSADGDRLTWIDLGTTLGNLIWLP